MAFIVPRTWTTGDMSTAAILNQDLRDNVNDLDARATVSNQSIATAQNTTSTTYVDLGGGNGPLVALNTGTTAFVALACAVSNSGAGAQCFVSVAVSGATTIAASDGFAYAATSGAAGQNHRGSYAALMTGLTPGNNTFTLKYRVNATTGTFSDRRLAVFPGNKLS